MKVIKNNKRIISSIMLILLSFSMVMSAVNYSETEKRVNVNNVKQKNEEQNALNFVVEKEDLETKHEINNLHLLSSFTSYKTNLNWVINNSQPFKKIIKQRGAFYFIKKELLIINNIFRI